MHLSDTEAAQRVADNDNLVGELVEALKDAVCALEVCGRDFDHVMSKAKSALAKAQGAQQ